MFTDSRSHAVHAHPRHVPPRRPHAGREGQRVRARRRLDAIQAGRRQAPGPAAEERERIPADVDRLDAAALLRHRSPRAAFRGLPPAAPVGRQRARLSHRPARTEPRPVQAARGLERLAAGRARRDAGIHPLARPGGARPSGRIRLRRGATAAGRRGDRPEAHAAAQERDFKSMAAGHAYPLYYDTLFVDLRDAFTAATATAREKKLGIWADDRSVSGIAIGDQPTLERDAVVFPKLFRRLTEYLKEHPGDAAGFVTWLADKREQVLDLTTHNFTHFDNVVEEKGGAVRLLRRPQELVFVSAKTSSRAVAPWLKV